MDTRFVLNLSNEISEVTRLLDDLEAFGKAHTLPPTAVTHLSLALDELVTNVIRHGFTDSGRHRFTVSVELDGRGVVAEIVDNGVPFDPFVEAAEPDRHAAVQERRIGGLGVHLVKTLMDEYGYHFSAGRNHTRIAKHLSPSGVKSTSAQTDGPHDTAGLSD